MAFFDMGHSKTTITIVRFGSNGKVEIILDHSNKNLGGRDIEWELVKKLCDDF